MTTLAETDSDFDNDDVASLSERARMLAPSPGDLWVSGKIRQRRIFQGLSVDGLAQEIGLSKNQLVKIEGGRNRVTAGRLVDIAKALNCNPGSFFDGMPGISDTSSDITTDLMAMVAHRDTLQMLRLWTALTPDQRKTLFATMENFAAGNQAIIQQATISA